MLHDRLWGRSFPTEPSRGPVRRLGGTGGRGWDRRA
jgi:hypothetical protein